MKKILVIILCISVVFLAGCENRNSDGTTTQATELTEELVRNNLFDNIENVDSITISCGMDEHVINEYENIEKIMNFLKKLELEEAEDPKGDGTSGMDLYVNKQKVMSIAYSGGYFCIGGKWYITEDSNAGIVLDSMCISFSKTKG